MQTVGIVRGFGPSQNRRHTPDGLSRLVIRTRPMDAQLPATEITALLGRGTRFEGKLTFEGRVRIDGIFKGEIKSEDVLIIGEGAEVHAEIDVATVIIKGGAVHGNIR